MAAKYFSNFPFTTYINQTVRNIVLRASFVDTIKQQRSVFYPYTIKHGERADTVAFNYYNDVNYVWLIYLFNDMIDPYYDWPLDLDDFGAFVADKYGSVEEAMSTIDHYTLTPQVYYLNADNNDFLTANQYALLSNPGSSWQKQEISSNVNITPLAYTSVSNPDSWTPMSSYDTENETNENKRFIKLLDKKYASQVSSQLASVLANN